MTAGRRRIVVVAPNWLGDAVMSLPAIGCLAAAPGVTLAVLAPVYTARVFDGLDGVDELWVDGAHGRTGRVVERARAFAAYAADAAVLLPPSFSSALAPWLARVPRRVGLATDGRRLLLTHTHPAPPRTEHLSTTYETLARAAVGGATPGDAVVPVPMVQDADRVAIRARLESGGMSGPYLLVVPGAAYGPAKAWPAERYREVCRRLAADIAVVVSGGGADRACCESVAAGLSGVLNLAGETGLGEFMALAAGATAVLANDSGAPHVAAALGTPVVVLFGSTSPAWTAPRGSDVHVVQHPVHCNPCFRRTCPTQLECFAGIGVEHVERTVRAAIGARSREPARS